MSKPKCKPAIRGNIYVAHLRLDCTYPFSEKAGGLSVISSQYIVVKTEFTTSLKLGLACKEIQLVNHKENQSWIFIGRTGAEAKTPILWPPDAKNWLIWKDPDKRCWERLRAGGEGYDRGWDGWVASPTWWTWVWVNSGSWWWTGRPGVLRFMGRRVGHDWVTELS